MKICGNIYAAQFLQGVVIYYYMFDYNTTINISIFVVFREVLSRQMYYRVLRKGREKGNKEDHPSSLEHNPEGTRDR